MEIKRFLSISQDNVQSLQSTAVNQGIGAKYLFKKDVSHVSQTPCLWWMVDKACLLTSVSVMFLKGKLWSSVMGLGPRHADEWMGVGYSL